MTDSLTVETKGAILSLVNLSASPYVGWVRVNTRDMDTEAMYCGHHNHTRGRALVVRGNATGLGTHGIDARVARASGERDEVRLDAAAEYAWQRPPLPDDPLAHFGGPATVNGVPLQWVDLKPDGAGYSAHLRARVGRMFVVDLWFLHYPDQPGWCQGEAMVTCSNPAVPDMHESTGIEGIVLRFGDAIVLPLGGTPFRIVPPATVFADGQARLVPLTFVWTRHLKDAQDWASAGAAASHHVRGIGLDKLLRQGNPRLPPGFTGFNAIQWAGKHVAESMRRLHTWEPALFGPKPRSGDAGEHSDTVFVGGEALAPGGVGADLVTYLAACKLAARPFNHREVDGAPLRLDEHPNLAMWDGRAHWHRGVSQDQLGKPRALSDSETNGWFGPDCQHFFGFTLLAAARLTGSPGLQMLLGNWARVYLKQFTAQVGPDSARSVAWGCLMAVGLYDNLADRELAEKVKAHCIWHMRTVILPAYGDLDVWDSRKDDPRLGAGDWWICWQQAAGAYGLDVAGEHFDVPEARSAAHRAARTVLELGWVEQDGRWLSCAQRPVAGAAAMDESFNYYGMPLAVAVCLRHDAANERAAGIWKQLVGEAREPKHLAWLCPGVR